MTMTRKDHSIVLTDEDDHGREDTSEKTDQSMRETQPGKSAPSSCSTASGSSEQPLLENVGHLSITPTIPKLRAALGT